MKPELIAKLKNIKLFLFDVDGILTDGSITWDPQNEEFLRTFHIRDGYGLRLLIQAGYKVGIISGGNSKNVKQRFEMLGAHYMHLGNADKRQAYLDCLNQAQVNDQQTLYMGDELFDIPLLKKAGFSATVPGATDEVKTHVDYVTVKGGGRGAVREVIDFFRKSVEMKTSIKDFD